VSGLYYIVDRKKVSLLLHGNNACNANSSDRN